MKRGIPKSLRVWFLIHFAVDMSFAIPLMIFPRTMMNFFNFYGATALARMVGAALFAIGGTSLFSYKKDKESFDTMLTLKILWSGAAIAGLLCSIFSGETIKLWFAVGIFFVFFVVWVYYKAKIKYNK
jgi:hypothetical protein